MKTSKNHIFKIHTFGGFSRKVTKNMKKVSVFSLKV